MTDILYIRRNTIGLADRYEVCGKHDLGAEPWVPKAKLDAAKTKLKATKERLREAKNQALEQAAQAADAEGWGITGTYYASVRDDGWRAGMAAAVAECRRIAQSDVLDNDDQRIGAMEAALAVMNIMKRADDAIAAFNGEPE